MTKTLSEICINLGIDSLQSQTLTIKNLRLDSREIKPGDAFIALHGQQQDGHQYIEQAIKNGAALIIAERQRDSSVPLLVVPHLKKKLAHLAAYFYDHPSHHLQIHAVTGTNGKTSCCQFISQAFNLLAKPCAYMGTLGVSFGDKHWPLLNTTPDPVTLQRILRELLEAGAKYIALEASSIALVEGRLQETKIHTAIFTNLTLDHLDYHNTMKAYADAKRILFAWPGLQQAVINMDDAFGRELSAEFSQAYPCLTYAVQLNSNALLRVEHWQALTQGLQMQISYAGEKKTLASSLLGEFNVSNLLATLAVLLQQQISFEQAVKILQQLKGVPGRLQCLGGENLPQVVIDYAHTPDALRNALLALRQHSQGKLVCVFGCGGNRDKSKRPLMGSLAVELADEIVVTSDNPRYEDPATIIEEILAGIVERKKIRVIADRHEAIRVAIQSAAKQDIVLLAGKGHEAYQEIAGQKFPFDDYQEAKKVLLSLG